MEKANLSYLKKLAAGDLDFEKKIIAFIKLEFPQEKKRYQQHFELKEFIKAAADVHKIKHKISVLDLKKNHNLATQHEQNLKNSNTDLASEFDAILEGMTAFINQL